MRAVVGVVVLLAAAIALGDTVVRSTTWNGKRYCTIRRGDGLTIEIKGALDMTPQQAMAKVPAAAAPEALGLTVLEDASTEAIVAEIKRRKAESQVVARMDIKIIAAEVARRKVTAEELGLAAVTEVSR